MIVKCIGVARIFHLGVVDETKHQPVDVDNSYSSVPFMCFPEEFSGNQKSGTANSQFTHGCFRSSISNSFHAVVANVVISASI